MGNNEIKILEELPINLKADILLARYRKVLNLAPIFRTEFDEPDEYVTRSFIRLAAVYFYTSGDYIVTQDDKYQGIYLILDGHVDILDEEYVKGTISMGDHIGEVEMVFDKDINLLSAL